MAIIFREAAGSAVDGETLEAMTSEAEGGDGFEAGRELLAVLRGMSNDQIRDYEILVRLSDVDAAPRGVVVKEFTNEGALVVDASPYVEKSYIRHFFEKAVNAGVDRLSNVKRIVIDEKKGKYECVGVYRAAGAVILEMERVEIDYKTDYADLLSEAANRGVREVDDIEEKEDLLPDGVVSEAVETLRRMY